MSYQVRNPYSVTMRPNGPALYAPPLKPIKSLGYIWDTPTLRVTTGDPGVDNLIKYGFWFGMAMMLYKLYGMLRYDEPLFSPGTPPAWKVNPRTRNFYEARIRFHELYEKGLDVNELSRACRVSRGTVYKWLHESGLPLPKPKRPYYTSGIEQKLIDEYEPGMNVAELARKHDLDASTVRNWLIKAGVYVPGPKGFRGKVTEEEKERRRERVRKSIERSKEKRRTEPGRRYRVKNPGWHEMIYADALQEALKIYEPGMNVAEMSRELGIPYMTLLNFLRRQDIYVSRDQVRIDKAKEREMEAKRREKEILRSPKLMEEVFEAVYPGLTVEELACQFHTTEAAIETVLRSYGIGFGRYGVVHPTHPISRERINRIRGAWTGSRKAAWTRRSRGR